MTPPRCQALTLRGARCTREATGFRHHADAEYSVWPLYWSCLTHRTHPPLRWDGTRVRTEEVPRSWRDAWILALERRQADMARWLEYEARSVAHAQDELYKARAAPYARVPGQGDPNE